MMNHATYVELGDEAAAKSAFAAHGAHLGQKAKDKEARRKEREGKEGKERKEKRHKGDKKHHDGSGSDDEVRAVGDTVREAMVETR